MTPSLHYSIPLRVELAAALKIVALGIGADETAFLVDELRVADGAELPPVILLGLGRLGLGHVDSPLRQL
jgi:hypothetical protein